MTIIKYGNNVPVGTEGKQEFPFDESPPAYSYIPPENTYGDSIDKSETVYHINETRARLHAGNTFFRSKSTGADKNNIWISSVRHDENTIIVTVSNDISTESYSITQDIGIAGVYTYNGINSLRTSINNTSSLIEMPNRGVDIQDTNTTETYLAEFAKSFLSGGAGLPINPTFFQNYPKTGPQRTIVHINSSEDGILSGSPKLLNMCVQWSGNSSTDGEWAQLGELSNRYYSDTNTIDYAPRFEGTLFNMVKHDVSNSLVPISTILAKENNIDIFDNNINIPIQEFYYEPPQKDFLSNRNIIVFNQTSDNNVYVNMSYTPTGGQFTEFSKIFYERIFARYIIFRISLINIFKSITTVKPAINLGE